MMSQTVLDTPPQPVSAFPADIDPIRFEVLRNALLAITKEMGVAPRSGNARRDWWRWTSLPGRFPSHVPGRCMGEWCIRTRLL